MQKQDGKLQMPENRGYRRRASTQSKRQGAEEGSSGTILEGKQEEDIERSSSPFAPARGEEKISYVDSTYRSH